MAAASDIVLMYVVPALGAFFLLMLFLSPLQTILEVNRRKALEEVNALPFASMLLACIGYVCYGFLIADWFIYVTEGVGLLLSMWYTLVCYKYSKDQAQDMLAGIILTGFALVFIVGIIDMAALNGEAARLMWGSLALVFLMVFYAAPTSTLVKVIRQRNSSSVHWPLCSMNVLSAGLWFAYGMALRDLFIAIPNAIGAALNIVCLVVCVVFPRGDTSLADELARPPNVGQNWSVLRLQSIRRPGGGSAGDDPNTEAVVGGSSQQAARAAALRSRSFFDVGRLKWRSERAELDSCENDSCVKDSGCGAAEQQQQQQHAQQHAMQVQVQVDQQPDLQRPAGQAAADGVMVTDAPPNERQL